MRPVEKLVRCRRADHHMTALPGDRQPAPFDRHETSNAEPGARPHHHHRRGRPGGRGAIVQTDDILRRKKGQREREGLEIVEEKALLQLERRGERIAVDRQPPTRDRGRVREFPPAFSRGGPATARSSERGRGNPPASMALSVVRAKSASLPVSSLSIGDRGASGPVRMAKRAFVPPTSATRQG